MIEPQIKVKISCPQGRTFKECNVAEKMTAMAPELEAFKTHMRSLPTGLGGGQLSPMEMALIRTYIAWKLSNVTQANSDHSD